MNLLAKEIDFSNTISPKISTLTGNNQFHPFAPFKSQYNLDVILWESFSTLERQNAFEDHDFVDVEFNPDNADELIGERN